MVDMYVSGVCNIGHDEVARRRNAGIVAFIIGAALVVVLVEIGVSPLWRLFVFFPATLSASAFLQAYLHFCTGFARRGLFNFGPIGHAQSVNDEAAKKRDKRRANWLMLISIVIGIAIAIGCVSITIC